MKSFAKLPLLFSLFVSTAFFAGCSSSNSGKVNHTEFCRAKYETAEELFKKGKYGRAQDKLEDILSLCAGTGYMEQSQFLLAESYFNLEEWIEARGEYGSFIINFPGSPFVETAEFRKAIASFNMEFRVSRDEANTTIAMRDFERYLSNYPDSPLRDSVNYYYDLLVERLAEKEFQTGRLYLRMDKPQAAVIYFKEFLETYQKSKRRREALFLIAQAYTELDQFEPARNYLAQAKIELPEDDKDVQKLLAKTEKKIAKAEAKFEKRLKKDSESKRQQKEEKQMLN
ncbi:outer membrane protein assembly factor BamD [Fibrobacter sp. UBA4309]|jgi:outer membrane protein assembly factor BamD|uniref:outer membrane protein assembly factor BamD n=1 Tax=Fibrobacter sp. UBA4309 TaxID=1946537 RepID=UPI0025C50AED|nr:outer membrane protein assembly factor BamD [Fibrobacter sp. UBA4309]